MVKSKKSIFKKLIILATALLLVLVGISCKGKKPTEEGGMELERPQDRTDVIGGTDGMVDPSDTVTLEKYKNQMINIRLISDSSDGIAYYRAPVVVAYDGAGEKTGMAIFYEKRFGQGGLGDVGVDGNAKVDIVFMANGKGGDNLTYSDDIKVGADPSASEGAKHSKGSPVVFVSGKDITIVAAAGAGVYGDHRGGSEVKVVRGTASGDTINFSNWEDLVISYTNSDNSVLSGSAAIRKYAKDKIDGSLNSFYTRWGHGKMSDDKKTWVLPLKFTPRGADGSGGDRTKDALLVLYSEDGGQNWKFGPHFKLGNTGYFEGLGLSVYENGGQKRVRLALVPNTPNNPIGIAEGILADSSSNATKLTLNGTSSFNDSQNNFEMNKGKDNSAYFINTQERSYKYFNGFIVNKKLTITLLSDSDKLQASHSMFMSRLAGSGSIAVLADGTIVTVAEEAFAENVREGENRYNIVQRRFTKEYVESHKRINEDEEYFNPNFDESY